MAWSWAGPECPYSQAEYQEDLSRARQAAKSHTDRWIEECFASVEAEELERFDSLVTTARDFGREDELVDVTAFRIAKGYSACEEQAQDFYDAYIAKHGPKAP